MCSAKAIWDFEGIFCSSRHIPHVRFAGLIHPGILGCAPSAEVLAEWNRREGELIAANTTLGRDVAKPPEPKSAHAGSATDEELKAKIAKEGARTIPVLIPILLIPILPLYTHTNTNKSYRAVPNTAATATSRTSPEAQKSTSPYTCRGPNSPWAIYTSAKALGRSPSAGRLKWQE